ncbi:MAG: GNAT family N-acetyltransferase [bacterium]|jgi:ribosomal protein S18 acetylase RimI-like enzyme
MATGMGIKPRQGTLNDLSSLIRLENISFGGDAFNRRQLRYLLTKANADVIILGNRTKVQGAAIMLWRKRSRRGHLYSIVIDPKCRGLGLGEKLLRQCEKAAQLHECDSVTLEVRSDNRAAIGLYTKLGYRIIKELPGYYADGRNGVGMLKLLKSR